MSRCFPYPPPGYVCNRATGDKALIGTIKIDKEKEKLRQEKKEQKKREKELKKQEKKEKKEKERLKSIQKTDDGHKRKRDCDGFEITVKKGSVSSAGGHPQKKNEPEAEQLERSSLTEEFGHPIVSESLCYSSDGTQSKAKNSRIEQSPPNGNCTAQGKVIRFRLKRKESENDLPADDMPSTSCRNEDPGTKILDPLPLKNTEDVIPSTAEQFAYAATSVRDNSSALISLPFKKVTRPKSVYEALCSEWVPPILFNTMEVNDDDENWLIPSKKQASRNIVSSNACDGLSGQQRMLLQPRAHLLPEVDLCVLPYTVPF